MEDAGHVVLDVFVTATIEEVREGVHRREVNGLVGVGNAEIVANPSLYGMRSEERNDNTLQKYNFETITLQKEEKLG